MTQPPHQRIKAYEDFWLFYLREHAKPATRNCHYLGTGFAVLAMAGAAALSNPWILLAVPFAGYGPAWISHFFIEKNRPATFAYPMWSLISDFRMAFRRLAGKIEADLERAGVEGPP